MHIVGYVFYSAQSPLTDRTELLFILISCNHLVECVLPTKGHPTVERLLWVFPMYINACCDTELLALSKVARHRNLSIAVYCRAEFGIVTLSKWGLHIQKWFHL